MHFQLNYMDFRPVACFVHHKVEGIKIILETSIYRTISQIIRYPQPRKSLQHVLWNYTSQWKRSATTPNPAWPCNTALPNGTLAIRCSFSYLQKASFGSTSQWKRWWQTLQQSLCPWTSFYHRWSSSTQWHRTHCSTMFPSYQHDLATQRFPMER